MTRHDSKTSGAALGPVALILFFLLLPAALQAGEVTLAWDPNSEENIAGYKLYYDSDSDIEMYQGTGANEGDSPVVIFLEDLADTDSPAYTLTGLESGQYYYFALTAFDTDGMESDFSDEVGTLVGAAENLNKSVDSGTTTDSDTTPGETVGFNSSSRSNCFITGAGTENLPAAAATVLLLLAAAAVMHLKPIPKIVRALRRRRRR